MGFTSARLGVCSGKYIVGRGTSVGRASARAPLWALARHRRANPPPPFSQVRHRRDIKNPTKRHEKYFNKNNFNRTRIKVAAKKKRGLDINAVVLFLLEKIFQAEIAQLGERQTEDLKVPGSIPGLGIVATNVYEGTFQSPDITSKPKQHLQRNVAIIRPIQLRWSKLLLSVLPASASDKHQWSSGRIRRCHRRDPGSIPG